MTKKYREIVADTQEKICEVFEALEDGLIVDWKNYSGLWSELHHGYDSGMLTDCDTQEPLGVQKEGHTFRIEIPNPEPPEGYELCEKDEAEMACMLFAGGEGWSDWHSAKRFQYIYIKGQYLFCRRIKQEVEYVEVEPDLYAGRYYYDHPDGVWRGYLSRAIDHDDCIGYAYTHISGEEVVRAQPVMYEDNGVLSYSWEEGRTKVYGKPLFVKTVSDGQQEGY